MSDMMYKRTIDFMDETVFSLGSFHAQKENPKPVAKEVISEKLSDQEIIDYVVDEMKDTLGS